MGNKVSLTIDLEVRTAEVKKLLRVEWLRMVGGDFVVRKSVVDGWFVVRKSVVDG